MLEWLLDDHPFITIGSLILILFGLFVWAGVKDEEHWEEYSKQHHCVPIAYKEATTSTGWGLTSNGKMGMVTITNPAQTTYQCDNGQYTR